MTRATDRGFYRPEGSSGPVTPVPDAGRTPLRVRRDATDALSVVAIDFGTSTSTVALYSDAIARHGPLDPRQARLLREGVLAVLDAPWPATPAGSGGALLGQVWEAVRRELPPVPGEPDDPASLLRVLRQDWTCNDSQQERQARILDAVYAVVDRYCATYPELMDSIGPLLHEGISRALRSAALEDNYLVCVPLVPGTDVIEVASVRGLKRRLADPVPLADTDWPVPPGWSGDTDLLLAGAYLELVRRVEAAAATMPQLPPGAQVESVVVTYPTTTPPAARARLRDLLATGLDLVSVNLSYDEGVAAALFYLMREFGGPDGPDLEAFRAHCRPTGVPGEWRQNLLVLDIGGGTTDIALLALELRDLTPPPGPESDAQRFAGRHYQLRPRVLGSTGLAHAGGDLLTLRTFYWLKARIVDALARLLTGREEFDATGFAAAWRREAVEVPGALAPFVVGYQKDGAAPRRVREALRVLLPTHRAAAGDEPFELLWSIAEQAKLHLGGSAVPFLPTDKQLADLASCLPPECLWRDEVRQLSVDELALSPEEFRRLVRPVIAAVVGVAADLAVEHLGEGPERAAEVLDRVALSGKSTTMPYLAVVTRAELAQRLTDGYVAWNSAGLTVEQELSKQAPALGACWAEAVRLTGEIRARDGVPGAWGGDGRDLVDIEVDNLLVSLPCAFELRDSGTGVEPLLPAGTRLEFCDRDGVLSARSGWRRLRPDIRVHRRIGADATVQWGRYRYQTKWVVHGLARRAGGTVEQPLPGSFQIEIGQDLTASIHVCAHEEPHYILDQEPLDLRRYLTAAAATGPGLVPRLPWEIHVGRVDQVGRFDIVPVFQGLGGRAGSPMPHRFHEVEPVGGEVGGVISPALPEGTGPRFEFFGVTATGAPVPLGSLPVPPSYGSPRYYATLDEFARLRVHPGYPSYLPARSLDEVFRIPGSVLREPMDPWHPDPDGDLDPFSGEH